MTEDDFYFGRKSMKKDVLELIDQRIEEFEEALEKGFSVQGISVLKELREEVEEE